MKRVILILADGMRPDSLSMCKNENVDKILSHSRYTLTGRTVMPSVTLPCHMSLFHSVDPSRHGILSNTYVPQVRPVNGLCEVLKAARCQNAFFYNWAELRDLARPGSLDVSVFFAGRFYGYEKANDKLTEAVIPYLRENKADFTFLYLGWPDEAGHANGWMSEEYLRAVSGCWDSIAKVCENACDDDLVIITADHGGHDRGHGSDSPEDMTIPIIFYNRSFERGAIKEANIIDIAPTVASTLGVLPDMDWEGKILDIG